MVARNELPPFPFTVDRFVEEVKSEAASMASQACAAFATLATKAVVPGEFRGAVPAVVALVEREGEGFDVAAKESALAALVALLACVEGAAEDAVGLGVVGKLVAAAAARDDGRLDVNAIEALRVLVTVEAAASAVVADESLINAVVEFVAERAVRPAPNPGAPDDVAEASLDLLCGLASKRSDGGACRDAVIRGGGVTVLARVLANARNDEVVIRALLGLAMTTAKEAQQAELVAAEGAAAALMRAMRSPDGDAAGVAKDLVNLLGRNPALKSQMAVALWESLSAGAGAGMDTA